MIDARATLRGGIASDVRRPARHLAGLAGRVRAPRPTRAETRGAAIEQVRARDDRLAELVRGTSAARLELGETLEAISERGIHHELGFSSLAAYARERCGRGMRWTSQTTTVARRLRKLPALREALASGALGWCMTELVARHATPETEQELTAMARTTTVRAMREHLSSLHPLAREGQMCAWPVGTEETVAGVSREDLARSSLVLRLSSEDAWLFEWTRRFAKHVTRELDDEAFLSALLAETFNSLPEAFPANDIDALTDEPNRDAEARWRAQLDAWREESERRCEANFRGTASRSTSAESMHAQRDIAPSIDAPPIDAPPIDAPPIDAPPIDAPPIDAPPIDARSGHAPCVDEASRHQLDARARELAAKLASRDVEIARAALAFQRVEGWRRLGYASASQYARERLGISPTSFKAKLTLARRLLPSVRDALVRRELGYEAALAISRVATQQTVDAWVARARARTVKHLWEEVRLAELTSLFEGVAVPPDEPALKASRELEGQLLAGNRDTVLARAPRGGRVALPLTVTRGTLAHFRALERLVARCLPRGVSFVRLLCDAFWETWRHECRRKEAYAHIYARDRYECASPVCTRRDVTPHHIRFRSRGGGDEPENVIALCTWCHLEGVHGGRLHVTGTASAPHWRLGRRRD